MTDQTWELELPEQDGTDSSGEKHDFVPPNGADTDREGDVPVDHTRQLPVDLGKEVSE